MIKYVEDFNNVIYEKITVAKLDLHLEDEGEVKQ